MTFPSIEGDKTWYTPAQKWTLDLAHFAKIEESDGVVMLNIENYLGESSLRELEWARMREKRVYWTLNDPRRRSSPGMYMYEPLVRELLRPAGGEWFELIETVKARKGG